MPQPHYTLYYSPAACSLAVHAVLNAVGADFTLVKTKIDGVDNRTREFLALSPMGQVPVLVEGEHVLRESAAIMIHLLDTAKHPLLPQSGYARAQALQWLSFFNSTMQQAYGAYFLVFNNINIKEQAEPSLQLFSKRINKLWRYVESNIAGEYMCGNEPAAADILMCVIAHWSTLIQPSILLGDKTKAICRNVSQLPYFAKALATEGLTY